MLRDNFLFSSAIDEVLLTMKAKTATEILDDATLVTYHSFDSQSYYDASSLRLKGTYANATFVNGKVNQAIDFQSNSSFCEVRTIYFVLSVCLNTYFRLTVFFCLDTLIDHIRFLCGFVRQSFKDRFLSSNQHQSMDKIGAVIYLDFLPKDRLLLLFGPVH